MTKGDTVTVAVDQAFVQRAADGAFMLVGSSLDGEEAERRWTALLAPYLGRIVAGPAARYLTFPGGFASVMRWGPDADNVHALLGTQTDLTPAVALMATVWPGWRDKPPTDVPMHRLQNADLEAPGATAGWRASVLDPDSNRADMLASTLAWLLQSPNAPLGLIGCPADDRVPLLWCLVEIAHTPIAGSALKAARSVLAARAWSFSTGGDLDNAAPPAIGFLDALPARTAHAEWIVVDLGRSQSASPRHVTKANALVYRYEFGIDPPADPDETPAPVSTREITKSGVQTGDLTQYDDQQSSSGQASWFEPLVRDLTAASDRGAFDRALDELEHAVDGRDDRDDLRAALEYEDWVVDMIRTQVPFQAREVTYDRVVRLAFGATITGRETATARVDAQRMALTSPSDELVRALARAPGAADLAPAIAQRWLRQPPAVEPERNAGLGIVGRYLARWWQPMTRDRERFVDGALMLAALLLAFALGLVVG